MHEDHMGDGWFNEFFVALTKGFENYTGKSCPLSEYRNALCNNKCKMCYQKFFLWLGVLSTKRTDKWLWRMRFFHGGHDAYLHYNAKKKWLWRLHFSLWWMVRYHWFEIWYRILSFWQPKSSANSAVCCGNRRIFCTASISYYLTVTWCGCVFCCSFCQSHLLYCHSVQVKAL